MDFIGIAASKFGTKIPLYLIAVFIIKVSGYLTQGYPVDEAVFKAIKDVF